MNSDYDETKIKKLIAESEKYVNTLTPSVPLHPEIKGGLIVFEEIKKLVPVEIIKKYAIVPTTYLNEELLIDGYSLNNKLIKEVGIILKQNYNIKKVTYIHSRGSGLAHYREMVLKTLKKYWGIEYTEEELRKFE